MVFQQRGLDPATVVISCDTLGKSFTFLGSCLFTYKRVSMRSAFRHALELNEYTASGLYDRACG